MKRQITFTIITLSLVALLLGGISFTSNGRAQRASLVATAHAQERNADPPLIAAEFPRRPSCSLGTVQGNYGYTAQGSIVPNPALPPGIPAGPYASQGLVTLDGFGNLTSLANDDFNGFLVPTSSNTGKYTVNENCTGTASFVGGASFSFTVVEGGKEILFMLVAPGAVATGVAKRL
jgi:hypothetical protein